MFPKESKDSDAAVVIPFIGLKNKGNTCYLNSVLQVLYHCPSFNTDLANFSSFLNIDGILEDKSNEENKDSLLLIREMRNLFLHLDKNQLRLIEEGENLDEDEIKDLSAVCPQEFIERLRDLYPVFEPYTQQDAQECFHCILNICNSVISVINENFEKRDAPKFLASESKVVGGRRSQSSVLTSNQNKENANSNRALSANSSSSTGKLLNRANKSVKMATLTEQRKNVLPMDMSDDETEMAMKKSPRVGCLKGLKRKRLKFSDIGQGQARSYEKLSKEVPSTSHEKENCNFSQLSVNSGSSVEPIPKRCRLGSQHPKVSSSQPQLKYSKFLKKFWKSKTESVFKLKHLSEEQKISQPTADEAVAVPVVQESATSTDFEIQPSSTSHDLKTSKASDFIKDMFHGQLVTTIKCMECESKVHRYESFQDVSLPVKNVQVICDVETAAEPNDEELSLCSQMDTCSLSWTLDHFTSSESLSGENKYFCDVCKRLSEGERSMRFNKLPPIITLHLKRFSTTSTDSSDFSTTVSKITSALEIPSTAKFTKWCSSECAEKRVEYELFGIVIHSGVSITGGHYLSYVKYNSATSQELEPLKAYDGRWLEMDDERARLLSHEEMEKALSEGDFDVPTKSAYMLFYHRVDSSSN